MLGDARAPKRRSKPTSYEKKNAEGNSHKTVAPGRDEKDDSGDAGTQGPARRATGGKPGPVLSHDKQNAAAQRTRRQPANTQGSIIDEWCMGKRGTYK